MIEFILAGLLVGLAVGTTGVGGGAIMTPVLILGFGVPPAVAVGTDLLFAAGTKGFGVLLHGAHGTVNWRIVRLLACGSLPATALMIYILSQIGFNKNVELVMTVALGVAVALTAIGVLLQKQIVNLSKHEKLAGLKTMHTQLRVPLTILGGVLLGLLVTLSSVGAGVIGTMLLLILYPRLRAIQIVGTDLAHAVPLTLVAGLGHWQLGTPDFAMLGWMLCGSIPGIYIGTKIGLRLPEKALRPIIAVMLLGIGVVLIVKVFA